MRQQKHQTIYIFLRKITKKPPFHHTTTNNLRNLKPKQKIQRIIRQQNIKLNQAKQILFCFINL